MKQAFVTLIISLTLSTALTAPQARTGRQDKHVVPVPVSKQESNISVSWEGTYVFQEGGGQTAGGTGMFTEHTLKVYRRGKELIADVDTAGFQVSRSLRCVAKAEENRLNFYFESYREDNITELYQRGQLLLSLERSISRGKTRILTYWAAYRPAFRTVRSGRVYFKKIG